MTSGAYVGMTAVILIDVIGLKKFIQGYGIQLFFMGMGLAIGPPIIGNSHFIPLFVGRNGLQYIHYGALGWRNVRFLP